RADPKWCVSHPQARVSALLRIGPRAAPVLLEKHPQPHLGTVEVVLGIERPQNLVVAHQCVETRNDRMKRLCPADGVVEGLLICLFHPLHCGARGAVIRCSPIDLRTRSVLSCTMALFMVD